ncbi:MAG: hypothetical protein CL830_01930 [Crocinitomicaceae bacterium]|nr:hypothetical protein [Crocinitomicaceae bacterium]|tara:strand:+ start:4634 stop:5131 length:498 start_codon:yes stop_codon:yes gene_type:complete
MKITKMKKILALLILLPSFLMAQEKLTYSDIIKIKNQDLFLKTVIEKGYSEGNSTSEKLYYGKGLSKDKMEATDWAEFTTLSGEFYFEQSNLEYSRKRAKGKPCYYDQIVSEIKSTCEYNKIMKHSSSKNGSVNFTTYKCPGAKYKGYLGFAQIDGNGVVQLFPK